jgi:hypothetical protein
LQVGNGAMNFIPALAVCFQIVNQKTRGALNFKELSQDGRWTDFSTKSPRLTLKLMTTYRMSLLLASSISLDNTLKVASLILPLCEKELILLSSF